MIRSRWMQLVRWNVVVVVATLLGSSALEGADRFTFPPEWEPHDAIWMAWPAGLDEGEGGAKRVDVWSDVVRALLPHVEVRMLVPSEAAESSARRALEERGVEPAKVKFVHLTHVDLWTRDSGPLFITGGQDLRLADFAWNFYGFSYPIANPDDLERGVGDREIAEAMELALRSSSTVAEGGALEVNWDVMVS